MKTKIILLASLFLFTVTAMTAQNNPKIADDKQATPKKTNGPTADYEKTVIDLGELNQGNPGTATFKLTNNGNEPLVISNAKASCGCTGLTYAKDPVLPGKTVNISATYNAAAVGEFSKSITVSTNASDQPVILMIKGKVLPKKE
jgi:hypothetical protein